MAYKQQKFAFSQFWKLEVCNQRTAWSARALFWVTDFMLYPQVAGGAGEFCGVSFIKALIPFASVPPSWPKHLPETPSPNITLGIGTSVYELGGKHKRSDHSRLFCLFLFILTSLRNLKYVNMYIYVIYIYNI